MDWLKKAKKGDFVVCLVSMQSLDGHQLFKGHVYTIRGFSEIAPTEDMASFNITIPISLLLKEHKSYRISPTNGQEEGPPAQWFKPVKPLSSEITDLLTAKKEDKKEKILENSC